MTFAASVIALAVAALAVRAWWPWLAWRWHQRKLRKAIDAEIKRIAGLKADVIRVGTYHMEDRRGAGPIMQLHGDWIFNLRGQVPAQRWDGKTYYFAGYTQAELIEIAARREEWVDREHV